jgi:hypothetical protein
LISPESLVRRLILTVRQNFLSNENAKIQNTKVMITRIATLIFCSATGLGPLILVGESVVSDVSFPEGFREWAHVKSALIGPGSSAYRTEAGIHHIYANSKALQGYRSGAFPEGSVIVYNLLETNTEAGITSEGVTRRVDVMVKNSRRYPSSGGWGFQSYAAGDPAKAAPPEVVAKCFECHGKQKEHGYVFSEFRK